MVKDEAHPELEGRYVPSKGKMSINVYEVVTVGVPGAVGRCIGIANISQDLPQQIILKIEKYGSIFDNRHEPDGDLFLQFLDYELQIPKSYVINFTCTTSSGLTYSYQAPGILPVDSLFYGNVNEVDDLFSGQGTKYFSGGTLTYNINLKAQR